MSQKVAICAAIVCVISLTGCSGGDEKASLDESTPPASAGSREGSAVGDGTTTVPANSAAKVASAEREKKIGSVTGEPSIVVPSVIVPSTVKATLASLDLKQLARFAPRETDYDEDENVGVASYQSKAAVNTGYDFHRKDFEKNGWKELPATEQQVTRDDMIIRVFKKGEFFVRLMVRSGNVANHCHVDVTHLSNVDMRRLPSPSDGVLHPVSSPDGALFSTDSSVDDANKEARNSLLAQGWKPYRFTGVVSPLPYATKSSRVEAFMQNGVCFYLNVSVHAAFADGKTTVGYFPLGILATDFPIINTAEGIGYNTDSSRLDYRTTDDVTRVAAFCRAHADRFAWKERNDLSKVCADLAHLVFAVQGELGIVIEIRPSKEKDVKKVAQPATSVNMTLITLEPTEAAKLKARNSAAKQEPTEEPQTTKKAAPTEKTEGGSGAEAKPATPKGRDTGHSQTPQPTGDVSAATGTPGRADAIPATKPAPGTSPSAPQAVKVTDLPFPNNATRLSIKAVFGDIKFESASSMAALTGFYHEHLTAAGWEEDLEARKLEDTSIERTYKLGKLKVAVEIEQEDDGSEVALDCEGITWDTLQDPAGLLAAGIPQSKARLFLQRELTFRENVLDFEIDEDRCRFKAPVDADGVHQLLIQAMGQKGWKQDAKTRRSFSSYERFGFIKGAVELRVLVYPHRDPNGSRVIVEYKNSREKPGAMVVAGLPVRDAADINLAGLARSEDERSETTRPALKDSLMVDRDDRKLATVATIRFGQKTITLNHAIAFQREDSDELKTTILFTETPISPKKLKRALLKEDPFASDFFAFSERPQYLQMFFMDRSVSVSAYVDNFSLSTGGRTSTNTAKTTATGLKGEVVMDDAKEFFNKKFTFSASFDVTLHGRNLAVPQPKPAGFAVNEEHDLPVPEGTEGVEQTATRYRTSVQGSIKADLASVAGFYRSVLAQRGWKEAPAQAKAATGIQTLLFEGVEGRFLVELRQVNAKTTLSIAHSQTERAKIDGVAPKPGQSQFLLGNAGTKPISILIDNKEYRVAAGVGARDPSKAQKVTVTPGTHAIQLKIPGEATKNESVDVKADSAWGVIVVPTGGHIVMQLY